MAWPRLLAETDELAGGGSKVGWVGSAALTGSHMLLLLLVQTAQL